MSSFSYRIQEEREERHKLKKLVRSGADPGGGGSLMMQDRPVRFDPMDGQPGKTAGDMVRVQWLSSRVLNLRSRGGWFEPRPCCVLVVDLLSSA